MKKSYDSARLGGPPGLYDSPNRDRETTGGIVQRVRVPSVPDPGVFYPYGPYNVLSLNDSDNSEDQIIDDSGAGKIVEPNTADLCDGIPFRKDISGDKM